MPRWESSETGSVLPRQRAAGGLEEGVLEPRELYSLPVLICGVAAIMFAFWLARDVLSRDSGTPAMQDIANRIYIGAVAFLRRQYSTIAVLAIFVAVVIGLVVGFFETEHQIDAEASSPRSPSSSARSSPASPATSACTSRCARTAAPPPPPGAASARR